MDDQMKRLVGVHVLIANDNSSNHILRLHLANLGMRFSAVTGYREALELLRSEAAKGDPFELAILELITPEMDAFKLARSIKEDEALLGTKIIILSPADQQSNMESIRAVGIEEALVKPVKQSRLYQCLTTVLSQDATSLPLQEKLSMIVADGQPSAATIRILLAEDNLVNQRVGLGQLKKCGYQADVVTDGKAVLEAISRVRYDIILMDCQMPRMDGYEATRTIRKWEQDLEKGNPGKPPVYIIALTANAMEGEREKCLALGMDDYLSKPMSETKLQDALERWQQLSA